MICSLIPQPPSALCKATDLRNDDNKLRGILSIRCAAATSSKSDGSTRRAERRARPKNGAAPAPAPVQPLPPPALRPSLSQDAFAIEWEACTIRGWPDGTLIYRFGSIEGPSGPTDPLLVQTTAWSNAVKLGVKFPQQISQTLAKLEQFVLQYDGGAKGSPKRDLRHSLHKTYENAVRKKYAPMTEATDAEGSESSSNDEEVSCEGVVAGQDTIQGNN